MKKLLIILLVVISSCKSDKNPTHASVGILVDSLNRIYYDNGAIKAEIIETNDGQEVIKEYYDSGIIKSEIIEKNDNKSIIKNYYENGNLQNFVELKGNLIHGRSEYYYENKVLMQRGVHINGLMEGLWEEFHPNGFLKRSMNIKRDMPYGCCDFHYQENGSLKEARLYSFAGRWICTIKYNQDGTLENVSGSNLTVLVSSDKLMIGDTLMLKIDQYVLPELSNQNVIEVIKNDVIINQFDINNNVFTLLMEDPGEYTFKVKSIYSDETNTISKDIIDSLNTDTLFDVRVGGDKI